MERGYGRRTRKQQIATLSIIAVAVITLSIGFAAFSSTLRISPQAAINPDVSTFSVIFSSDGSNTDIDQTVEPSSTEYGSPATITNGTSPTLTGIKAQFTEPGQSVSYLFYAKNTGSYLAYLNYIIFNNVEGANKNIVCTPLNGTSNELVQEACQGINLSIKVGNEDAVTTNQSGISDHTLKAGDSEPIVVTITYDENAKMADGDFSVEFGDISLTYSTVNDKPVQKSCTLTDSDGNGSASISDIVTCGTERFHVMYNTGNEITMLSMYNLNVGDNAYKSGIKGIQNENALGFKYQVTIYGNVSFSATNYWTTSVSSYPSEVFNSNSSIYGYVREYETYLTSQLKVISAKATLITYQQLLDLGCSGTTCGSAPSWVTTTSYWTATASDASNIWRVSTSKDVVGRAINYSGIGVRPVVTISTDELK